jgi:patatin-like phospholipase/acyl hydrolase
VRPSEYAAPDSMATDLRTRLKAPGPKRILSLDGGGIRGSITVGFLERIEAIVQARMGPAATLADYFDLIGGTSTGAIIATLLALGHSVARVKDSYLRLGTKVFSTPTFLARLPIVGRKLFTAWSVHPLEEQARALLSEKTTLGSPSIRTGLCIVAKRADTFGTWTYINHPDGKFYRDNAEIPLWKLIRATSAAPTYFRPIQLDVGEPGKPDYGVFIDGGVSMANNPALLLFLVATLQGFPFRWKTGGDDLLIVSLGTGRWKQRLNERELLKSENVYWASRVPDLLMHDASKQNELMLQYLSDSPTARPLDLGVGALEDDLLGDRPQLSYIRYNAVLDKSDLAGVGVNVSDRELVSLRDMSVGANAPRLYEIGAAFAQRQVDPQHFSPMFDPAGAPA